MNTPSEVNWNAIAAELRAIREAQRSLWGDIDDMGVARFLAGTATDAERLAVERAMDKYPAVAELVRDLRQFELIDEASATGAAGDGDRHSPWEVKDGRKELATSLVVRGERGRGLTSQGLARWKSEPVHISLDMPLSAESPRSDVVHWTNVPLEPCSAVLSITCRRSPNAVDWELLLACQADDSSDLPSQGWVSIEHVETNRCEIKLGLAECVRQPIVLDDGRWRIRLVWQDQLWLIPLELQAENLP